MSPRASKANLETTPLKNSGTPENRQKETVDQVESRLRTKIRDWINESFEEFIHKGKMPLAGVDIFNATETVLEALDCPNDPTDSRYTKEQQERVPLFFDEMHAFARRVRHDPNKREVLSEYMGAWYKAAFSVSPNVFNWMKMEDQLVAAARFSRIPETRDSLGFSNTGELVYNLRYMRGSRESFMQRAFNTASPEARLDLLHYLATVGSDGLVAEWSEEVGNEVYSFLQTLARNKAQSPFVHYVSSVAAQAIRESGERYVPGWEYRTEDKFPDDQEFQEFDNDWEEDVRQEDVVLGMRIAEDASSYVEPIYRRISKDIIAGCDSNYVPQAFAQAGKEIEQRPRKDVPHSQDLDHAIELLAQPSMRQPTNLPRVTQFLHEKIFSVLPKSGWTAYWESQRNYQSDPEFFSKVQQELVALRGRLGYTELHFEPFDLIVNDEHDTILLQELHHPAVRQQLEKDMGISLADLTLREQTQLLGYLARVDAGTAVEGLHAIRSHGLNGARSFLSCEHGKEYGDAILTIAKTLDHRSAEMIFKKYAELADLAEQTTDELVSEVFVQGKGGKVDQGQVNEELLSRAKDLLATMATQVQREVSAERVAQELERYKADMLLLASVFKTAYKGKEKQVDFNELKGMSVEEIDPQELSPAEQKKMFAEMKEVLMSNWKGKGIEEMQLALHGLEEGFGKKKGQTRFHRLQKGNETIAFLRFDSRADLGKDAVYAGSFNVQPGLRGAALGSALFHHVLDRKAQDHPVFAHVLASDRVASNYVEEFGFMITGVEREVHEGGKESIWFTIERNDELRSHFEKRRTRRTFEIPSKQSELVHWIEQETAGGTRVVTDYVLSRGTTGSRAVVSVADVPSASRRAA